MKSRLIILGLLAALWVAADTVILEWNPCRDARLGGYRVYYGTNSRVYPFTQSAGLATTSSVVLPWRGPWFFAVTAHDTNGFESDYSNEAALVAKPESPVLQSEPWVSLRPVIECSTNLISWSSITGAPTWFCATNAQEFFRTRELVIESVNKVETEP